jgi:hypothetical protein
MLEEQLIQSDQRFFKNLQSETQTQIVFLLL